MKKENREFGLRVLFDAFVKAYKEDEISKFLVKPFYVGVDRNWITKNFVELTEKNQGKLNAREFVKIIFDEFEQNIINSVPNNVENRDLIIDAIVHNLLIFLENFDEDCNIILKYKNILLSKKRQVLMKDKWGDLDSSGWKNLLIEFSHEKLVAGKVNSFLEEEIPHTILVNLRNSGVGNLGLWLCLACLESNNESVDDREISGGLDFENFIKEKIEEVFPEFVVSLTPATGDQGADLILFAKDKKIVIQAKFYKGSVGNTAVQEVYAAKAFYEADDCLVITSSNYTSSAKLLAEKTDVFLASNDNFIDVIKQICEI